MGVGHMRHQLGITAPTIGHHLRGREVKAASATRRQGFIEHDLRPLQFGAAAPPWAFGIGPSHLKVNGHDQLTVADDDQEQHTINAVDDALVLPTPPRADEFELRAIWRAFYEKGPSDEM